MPPVPSTRSLIGEHVCVWILSGGPGCRSVFYPGLHAIDRYWLREVDVEVVEGVSEEGELGIEKARELA
ncbi:hypothetical protein E2562_017572 [Oryza meyeriana var. granulata]|uniref:Uncharacterized protein n=1 Tax=Oryza meyeriana var. granulata TaxID=110450 RepID=A0A6G1C6Z3_9ORYZ|nr:hypothetical protein E2562_017572 [Oryza meyeriana var. granulata]